MEKTDRALILIEFQQEWLADDGKLNKLMEDRYLLQGAKDNAKRALAAAREANFRVIHCGLGFQENYPELGKPRAGLQSTIQEAGTFLAAGQGSRFVEPFTPSAGEFVVQGRTGGSAFAGSNLDVYLRNQRVNHIYLAGFALHVCIESTLRQGHDQGYEVVVLSDACAAFNQAQQAHVLDAVVHHFGKQMNTDDFVRSLEAKAA